jgi:CAAX protease family protein
MAQLEQRSPLRNGLRNYLRAASVRLTGWKDNMIKRETLGKRGMGHSLRWPVIGVLVAIAGTSALDAAGLSAYVANSLLIPLFLLFWYLQRMSRSAIGLTWGRWRDYALAVLYPVLVLAVAAMIAWLSGAVHLVAIDWAATIRNLVVLTLVTIVGAIVTEDGFFRGWLWASLQRAGVSQRGLLVWTSLAFAAWHVSKVLLPTDFRPSISQAPIFILNVAVIGLIWALMRQRTGSIVVISVSHGIWNGLVYTLFNEGPTIGVLGIHNIRVFSPESGLLGLALNLAFAAVLWFGLPRSRGIKEQSQNGQAVETAEPEQGTDDLESPEDWRPAGRSVPRVPRQTDTASHVL